MCSWCWGFSPVLKQIQQDYSKDAPLRLIVGGLHAFDTDPMNDQYKATIKHHWEQVAEASGQPFNYAFFEREGFVLDTEPACRATVVVRNMNPDVLLPFGCLVVSEDHETGRDAGPVEQVRSKPDHTVDQSRFQQVLSDFLFSAASEEDSQW